MVVAVFYSALVSMCLFRGVGNKKEGGLITPVVDAHRVVVCLRWEGFFGVLLDFGDEGVFEGEVDVLDEDGCWLVEVGFSLKDGVGVGIDGGPAVLGDGVVGGHSG